MAAKNPALTIRSEPDAHAITCTVARFFLVFFAI